jgi:hypothetical protein
VRGSVRQGTVERLDRHGQAVAVLRAPGKLPRPCVLGHWWLRAARDGAVPLLPLLNMPPALFEPQDALVTLVHSARLLPHTRQFEWTLAVHDPVIPVASVRFELHETFSPPCVILHEEPFRLQRTGWGEFDIGVRIVFCDESFVDVVHSLDLSTAHGQQTITISQRQLLLLPTTTLQAEE